MKVARVHVIRVWLAVAGVLLLALPGHAKAQGPVSVSGRITNPGNQPIVRARIHVAGTGGYRAETFSDSAGAFRFQLPSGGTYVLAADAPGMTPLSRTLEISLLEREAFVTLTLTPRVVALEPLKVVAQRLSVAEATRWVPGTRDQSRSALDLRVDPVGTDFLTDVLDFETGVAAAADGASISGQPADQTRLTLDENDPMGATLPREAIRSVGITTSTFDVGRGQLTGGQVDVRSQRGGNRWGGSLRLDVRDAHLQYGDAPPGLQARTSQLTVDAGAGGAIVRDRLFVHGALSLRQGRLPAPWFSERGTARSSMLGIDPDTLARFYALTEPWRPAESPGSGRTSTFGTGMVRVDAEISSAHSLVLRFNGQQSASPDQLSRAAVGGTGTQSSASNAGLLMRLSSGGEILANELTASFAVRSAEWESADPAPVGVVRVPSASSSHGMSGVALRFAGSSAIPRTEDERVSEFGNELVLKPGAGEHRVRVGAQMALREYDQRRLASHGRFEFASLAELERRRPSLYARTPAGEDLSTDQRRVSLFIDDHWDPGAFQLTYGVRAERVWYSRPADPNPDVQALFGRVAGHVPSGWRVSPRVGFAVTTPMPWGGPDRMEIQGGLGEFVGAHALSAVSPLMAEVGDPASAELVCLGPAAPSPDWMRFRSDPASIPGSCADGAPTFASRLPSVTIFAPEALAPRVWRGSLGAQGSLGIGIWSLSAAVLRGVNQPVSFDRNAKLEPVFLNNWEAGRPAYVGVQEIDPATGIPSLSASRRFEEFGLVRELTGEGRSRTVQVTGSLGRFWGDIPLLGQTFSNLGYTWTDGWETVGPLDGGLRSGSTSGGPATTDWAVAGATPRHMLFATASMSLSNRVSVTLRGRWSSGLPFTPLVAGDVNADGSSNDRAFVFDPRDETGNDLVSSGMQQLLTDAPSGVRDCLASQLGRVAAHHSCRTGWSSNLDLNARISLGPKLQRSAQRRLTFWVVANNLTSAVDYLVHGPEDVRGWGQPASVDETLLTVRGFDAEAARYHYDVNRGFGRAGVFGRRIPFSLSLQVRVVVGVDRPLASYHEARDAAANRGAALQPANLLRHLRSEISNVPREVLALNGPARLYLEPAQARRLEEAADSLGAEIERVIAELVAAITSAPSSEVDDLRRYRALARDVVRLRATGVEITRATLSAEQWTRVPRRLRAVRRGFAPLPVTTISVGADFE